MEPCTAGEAYNADNWGPIQILATGVLSKIVLTAGLGHKVHPLWQRGKGTAVRALDLAVGAAMRVFGMRREFKSYAVPY